LTIVNRFLFHGKVYPRNSIFIRKKRLTLFSKVNSAAINLFNNFN
jgi:hypothetical protein